MYLTKRIRWCIIEGVDNIPILKGEGMKRLQMYFTKRQIEKLSKKAKETGISLSELVRRILDKFLDGVKE